MKKTRRKRTDVQRRVQSETMKAWWAKRKAKLAKQKADAQRQSAKEKWEAEKQAFLDSKTKGLLTPAQIFQGKLKFFGFGTTFKEYPKKPSKPNG